MSEISTDEVLADLLGKLAVEFHNASAESRHFTVAAGDDGVKLTELSADETMAPHRLIRRLLTEGATVAGYVSYLPALGERVMVQVVVGEPPQDSDIRKSHVLRRAGSVRLAPWEYAVT